MLEAGTVQHERLECPDRSPRSSARRPTASRNAQSRPSRCARRAHPRALPGSRPGRRHGACALRPAFAASPRLRRRAATPRSRARSGTATSIARARARRGRSPFAPHRCPARGCARRIGGLRGRPRTASGLDRGGWSRCQSCRKLDHLDGVTDMHLTWLLHPAVERDPTAERPHHAKKHHRILLERVGVERRHHAPRPPVPDTDQRLADPKAEARPLELGDRRAPPRSAGSGGSGDGRTRRHAPSTP